MSGVVTGAVHEALAELTAMDRKALTKEWEVAFGCPAPRGAQVTLLRGALAWRSQIGHEADSELAQLVRRLHRQAASPAPTGVLSPGTRLLREWQGQTHHVTVLADGYEYNGKAWRSLSAISRQITGTAWSGPVFFGLK